MSAVMKTDLFNLSIVSTAAPFDSDFILRNDQHYSAGDFQHMGRAPRRKQFSAARLEITLRNVGHKAVSFYHDHGKEFLCSAAAGAGVRISAKFILAKLALTLPIAAASPAVTAIVAAIAVGALAGVVTKYVRNKMSKKPQAETFTRGWWWRSALVGAVGAAIGYGATDWLTDHSSDLRNFWAPRLGNIQEYLAQRTTSIGAGFSQFRESISHSALFSHLGFNATTPSHLGVNAVYEAIEIFKSQPPLTSIPTPDSSEILTIAQAPAPTVEVAPPTNISMDMHDLNTYPSTSLTATTVLSVAAEPQATIPALAQGNSTVQNSFDQIRRLAAAARNSGDASDYKRLLWTIKENSFAMINGKGATEASRMAGAQLLGVGQDLANEQGLNDTASQMVRRDFAYLNKHNLYGVKDVAVKYTKALALH